MKKTGLHIAFAILIILLVLPAVQMSLRLFPEKPLEGAFTLAEKPSFTREKWNSGEFQEQAENYLKDHSGFRNFLVRLQNQLDFSLFRQVHAEGVVVGKNKQLFEYDYIRSWLAIDFPGDSFLEKKLRRTKFVQEYLKREKGIDLIVVFEPGKASFYPEYLPSEFTEKKTCPSTYQRYLEKARGLDVDFIDLHQYFLQLKDTSEYPLFPRYGTHWSVYGMWFAADSLLYWMEGRLNFPLTSVRGDSTTTSTKPRDTDDDVLKTMNLLFPLKGEKLAYPVFSFDTAHPAEKPWVLAVADSYYWNIFNTQIPKYVFANEAFWYFNSLVYPDHYLKPTYTKDLDFKKEVEKNQVIFLMVTERFVHKFDWKFIDQLYDLFAPDWLEDPVYDRINSIMQVDSWYNDIIRKAELKGISLEEALITEAEYMFYQDDTLRYMIGYGPGHFQKIIAGDSAWMAHVREKALRQNMPVDEMLQADALYVFHENYPWLYELNRCLTDIEERLYSNGKAVDSLKQEADDSGCEPAFFIRQKAWQLCREEQLQKIRLTILNDPSWLGDVKQKALNNSISLEEMIRLDAIYVWEQKMKEF